MRSLRPAFQTRCGELFVDRGRGYEPTSAGEDLVASFDERQRLVNDLQAAARDLLAPEPATCFTAREETGEALVCFTAHPFRSDAARAAFDALAARIAACLPEGAEEADAVFDKPVNHPDSYDDIAWLAPGARISLSLKDKGGEGRTLMFLRVTAAE